MLNPETINKNVWNRLTKIYKKGQISGAYLFIGSRGLGKMELAFDFISLEKKWKNKRNLIEAGIHPDVVVVRPEIEEKNGKIREKQISIEQTQEALRMFSYFPQEMENKFLLIESIDKLTVNAGNNLLKTIEELSGNFVIILTASGEDGVLDTIKSRCQRIYFNLKTKQEIEKFIKKQQKELDDYLIKDIVIFSRGRIKETERILKDLEYLKKKLSKLTNFRKALKGDLKIGFQIAQDNSKDTQLLNEYIMDWIYYLRVFLKKNILNDQDVKIQKKIFQILKELNQTRKILVSNSNVNNRLLLENFFVQIK